MDIYGIPKQTKLSTKFGDISGKFHGQKTFHGLKFGRGKPGRCARAFGVEKKTDHNLLLAWNGD